MNVDEALEWSGVKELDELSVLVVVGDVVSLHESDVDDEKSIESLPVAETDLVADSADTVRSSVIEMVIFVNDIVGEARRIVREEERKALGDGVMLRDNSTVPETT